MSCFCVDKGNALSVILKLHMEVKHCGNEIKLRTFKHVVGWYQNLFLSHLTIEPSSKRLCLFPGDHLQTLLSLILYAGLGVGASSIHDSLSGHLWCRARFEVDLDTLRLKYFTSSFVIVLRFSWTFWAKVRSALGIICSFFLNDSVTVCLQDFCTCVQFFALSLFRPLGFFGATILFLRSHIFAWIFTWYQVQRVTDSEGWPLNRGALTINNRCIPNCLQIMTFGISEASKKNSIMF